MYTLFYVVRVFKKIIHFIILHPVFIWMFSLILAVVCFFFFFGTCNQMWKSLFAFIFSSLNYIARAKASHLFQYWKYTQICMHKFTKMFMFMFMLMNIFWRVYVFYYIKSHYIRFLYDLEMNVEIDRVILYLHKTDRTKKKC